MTQEQIAVDAGIDEMSASARMSRYGEQGKRTPISKLLYGWHKRWDVPVEFLYA